MQTHGLSVERNIQSAFFPFKEQFEYDQFLLKIALDISRSLDIHELLTTTATEVRQLLDVDRVIIYRFDPDWSGSVVVESVAQPYPSMMVQARYDSVFGQALIQVGAHNGDSVGSSFGSGALSKTYLDFLLQFQIKSNLVIPILAAQGSQMGQTHCSMFSKVWGLLAVQQCSASRVWQAAEIEVLQNLAIYLEPAIHRTELYDLLETGGIAYQAPVPPVQCLPMQPLPAELEDHVQKRTLQLQLANQQLQQDTPLSLHP